MVAVLLKLCFRDLDAIASWFVLRNLCGEEIPFPLNQIFDWSRQVLLVLFQCSTCPALSRNLLHTLNLGQYAMIYNEVRQIIVAWLPFLFLSNLSKTFSKPFLLALSSPSLFICMKAIVVQMCRHGKHLLGVPPKPQLKAAVDIGREKLATRKPLVRGVEGRKRRFYS